MMLRMVAWMLPLVAAAAPAAAGRPVEVEMKCVVGGTPFTHVTASSYTIFWTRPDGMPFGSWQFPVALPECPDNKLVMYRDFTPDEIAPLAALVASPEYAALAEETDYYRAQWLHTRLVGSEMEALGLLMQAGWQFEPGSAERNRHLDELIRRVDALPPAPADLA